MPQGLGLLQDSWSYADSAFYQGWSNPTEFTPIDRAIIRLPYEPKILPGMTLTDLEATRSHVPYRVSKQLCIHLPRVQKRRLTRDISRERNPLPAQQRRYPKRQ